MKLFGVHLDNKKDSCPVQDKGKFFAPLKETRQACSILFIRWCKQNLIGQHNRENTRILMSKKSCKYESWIRNFFLWILSILWLSS